MSHQRQFSSCFLSWVLPKGYIFWSVIESDVLVSNSGLVVEMRETIVVALTQSILKIL